MTNIITEIKKRLYIIIGTIITLIYFITKMSNKILILIIQPLLKVNIELYNIITYSIINRSFNIYDIQQIIIEKKNYIDNIDYVPTIELNLPLIGTQTIYLFIMC